jgi:hypothetical protein
MDRCPALAAPRGTVSMLHLTCSHLGPGFGLMDLPEIMHHMTRLAELHLKDGFQRQLPSLSMLTALLTLELSDFVCLQQLLSLATHTALKKLSLSKCPRLVKLPKLDTLTALNTLDVLACSCMN